MRFDTRHAQIIISPVDSRGESALFFLKFDLSELFSMDSSHGVMVKQIILRRHLDSVGQAVFNCATHSLRHIYLGSANFLVILIITVL